MGKCLGEKKLNKKAASGIYGLEIRYSTEWAVFTACYWLELNQGRDIFLLLVPIPKPITLYTVIIITAVIHNLNHSS